jgi:hypothetical protein
VIAVRGSLSASILASVFALTLITAILNAAADRLLAQPLNKLPPARTPCSVLSDEPCHPSFCDVFHRGPCFPQFLPPIGQDLRLTIVSTDNNEPASGSTDNAVKSAQEAQPKPEAASTQPSTPAEKGASEPQAIDASEEKPLDSIRAMYAALRACWVPPPKESARHGMEYTIRFAFKRDGEIVAPPRVTYASHDASEDVRDVYRDAVKAALARCTPFHFSDGMRAAVAGRPIAIRFVDHRSTDKSLQ